MNCDQYLQKLTFIECDAGAAQSLEEGDFMYIGNPMNFLALASLYSYS